MKDTTILHSDMNCFYASVEMMLNPELRNKAVAVCGATEDRHGIVLAKSERAKKAGVKTGMVNWEAKRLCPDLILVPPQYDQYLKYSKLAHEIYYRYTDLVEPFGMDECWLDVSCSTRLYGSGEKIAQNIRKAIKEELGLTVSIGVSYHKIFAKLGSDIKKPDAITRIEPDNYESIVYPLPVEDLLYVGPATSKKLRSVGISTIGQLAQTPEDFLHRRLGKMGIILSCFAKGLDNTPVQRSDFTHSIKSVGNSATTPRDLVNDEDVFLMFILLSDSVCTRMRELASKCSVVEISIRDTHLTLFYDEIPYF